jgi:ABC-2 type transport system ATP-binding protein
VEMVCDRVAMVDRGRVIASGTLDQLLGGKSCRLRVTGLDVRQRAGLRHFGELDDDGEWLTVRGLDPERVPELVEEIVRLGGRVYAVEPRQLSLEDRFLQLLGNHES